MSYLGRIEVDGYTICEVGDDGHISVCINLEDVDKIEFKRGIAAERPFLQLILCAVSLPIFLWSIRMFAYDFNNGFPSGNVRPAICGFFAVGLPFLIVDQFKQFAPQAYMHVSLLKGARKLRFGSGVTVDDIKLFHEKLNQTLVCHIIYSL